MTITKLGTDFGTAQNKTSSLSLVITVANGPLPVGSLAVVTLARNFISGSVTDTCVDSQGNTWIRGVASQGGSNAAVVFASLLTAGLQTGDTVTITFPGSTDSKAAALFGFAGSDTTAVSPVADQKTANGTTTVVSVPANSPATVVADKLLVTVVAVDGPIGDGYTEDPALAGGDMWHTLTRVGTSGGAASSNIVMNAAYRILTSAAAMIYAPTLGTDRQWTGVYGSYRPAVPPNRAVTVQASRAAQRASRW
jgi:hypothetical protein